MVAKVFDESARGFLGSLDFVVINDPERALSPYRKSWALYRDPCGLHLLVDFEAADGNYAGFSCGRAWCSDEGILCLSGEYQDLCWRLDLSVPEYYRLGYAAEMRKTMDDMLDDIERAQPTVAAKVTLDDLLAIEREEHGSERHAVLRFGKDYAGVVTTSASEGSKDE